MSTLKIHSINSAPQNSKPLLEDSVKSFGMLPNLHGVLAESPVLLEAYKSLHDLFQKTSFNAEELTVVWQTINVEHECHYCVPAHTAIANMMKVDPVLTEALRNKAAMPNDKLQVLHDTTLSIVRNRGKISEAELEAFYSAGYGQQQVLEIILGLSQKVISNYTNHIAKTPVDEPFQKFSWVKQVEF
ncbi:carboxymuconolactone decarboxylase family protein [Aquimarina sp. 2201CG5-10]|uniref:carboxymuconolactone decarboxylase family protein n=1 Tax=Aquimarina callyspongiae TaxID=3098150 RepID=UPI002AB3D9EE|nr:carboxymuconolactone decarboxylase family protein [Aquimarina sp. 2201CG5-10]MDY8135655.1 carboxymuconolactone decarboxylase family protein [Aquimarina sp. 2201CG5-10]